MLPWLAILTLLALKPNRGLAAWWIWLPLGVLVGGCRWLQLAMQGPSTDASWNAVEVLWEVPLALMFGLTALWLLAPYLGGGHRFRTFFGSLAVLAGFMVFSFAARVGWGVGADPVASLLDPRHCAATASVGLLALPFFIPLVLQAPVIAAAMMLCGLVCRGRYQPIGLCLWLFMSLLAVCVAGSVLLNVVCRIASSGGLEYAPFLGIGLLMVMVTSAALLPFLILSWASSLFRERLKALLHV